MTSRRPPLPALPLLLLLLVVPGHELAASSYVATTDDELLERSSVVVYGRALEAQPAIAAALPATDHLFQIDRVLKGFVPASTLLVRIPGGITDSGVAARVWGAPVLDRERPQLLFLDPGDDFGVFQVVESGLGSFHELEVEGRTLLVRDLSASQELLLPNDERAEERRSSHLPRDAARFLDWLEARASGVRVEADYFVSDPVEVARTVQKFELIRSGTANFPDGCGPVSGGNFARVFEFDSGGRMEFRANDAGQKGVNGGGFDRISAAMEAWNGDGGSRIALRYAGRTSSQAGSSSTDGQNLILFGDPNDAIPGSYTGGGGTLAQTITFFSCNVRSFSGGQAHPIVEADIVTQDGFDLYLAALGNDARNFEEIMGHELGHAMGIAHPCERNCSGIEADALMRGTAHGDNRGARLGRDDRDAVAFVYPSGSGGGGGGGTGGGGGGGGGGGTVTVPAAPGATTATTLSTSRIRVTWIDQSNNEDLFVVQERTATGKWVEIETLPAGSTTLEVINVPAGSYRAYRVRARNSAGDSAWSNIAGATTDVPIGPCIEDSRTVCLRGDRFRVRASFATSTSEGGEAIADRLTGDTGFFTFFNPDNVEVVVKVLDNCSQTGRFWVFASGLTDREVVVTVADTERGDARTYINELGNDFPLIKDFGAFATCP